MLAAATQAKQQHAASAGAKLQQQYRAEVFVEPPTGGPWCQASVELGRLRGWQELWKQLKAEFPSFLPDREWARFKVVYLDSDGDWVLVMQDLKWRAFCEAATKVLVCTGA